MKSFGKNESSTSSNLLFLFNNLNNFLVNSNSFIRVQKKIFFRVQVRVRSSGSYSCLRIQKIFLEMKAQKGIIFDMLPVKIDI